MTIPSLYHSSFFPRLPEHLTVAMDKTVLVKRTIEGNRATPSMIERDLEGGMVGEEGSDEGGERINESSVPYYSSHNVARDAKRKRRGRLRRQVESDSDADAGGNDRDKENCTGAEDSTSLRTLVHDEEDDFGKDPYSKNWRRTKSRRIQECSFWEDTELHSTRPMDDNPRYERSEDTKVAGAAGRKGSNTDDEKLADDAGDKKDAGGGRFGGLQFDHDDEGSTSSDSEDCLDSVKMEDSDSDAHCTDVENETKLFRKKGKRCGTLEMRKKKNSKQEDDRAVLEGCGRLIYGSTVYSEMRESYAPRLSSSTYLCSMMDPTVSSSTVTKERTANVCNEIARVRKRTCESAIVRKLDFPCFADLFAEEEKEVSLIGEVAAAGALTEMIGLSNGEADGSGEARDAAESGSAKVDNRGSALHQIENADAENSLPSASSSSSMQLGSSGTSTSSLSLGFEEIVDYRVMQRLHEERADWEEEFTLAGTRHWIDAFDWKERRCLTAQQLRATSALQKSIVFLDFSPPSQQQKRSPSFLSHPRAPQFYPVPDFYHLRCINPANKKIILTNLLRCIKEQSKRLAGFSHRLAEIGRFDPTREEKKNYMFRLKLAAPHGLRRLSFLLVKAIKLGLVVQGHQNSTWRLHPEIEEVAMMLKTKFAKAAKFSALKKGAISEDKIEAVAGDAEVAGDGRTVADPLSGNASQGSLLSDWISPSSLFTQFDTDDDCTLSSAFQGHNLQRLRSQLCDSSDYSHDSCQRDGNLGFAALKRAPSQSIKGGKGGEKIQTSAATAENEETTPPSEKKRRIAVAREKQKSKNRNQLLRQRWDELARLIRMYCEGPRFHHPERAKFHKGPPIHTKYRTFTPQELVYVEPPAEVRGNNRQAVEWFYGQKRHLNKLLNQDLHNLQLLEKYGLFSLDRKNMAEMESGKVTEHGVNKNQIGWGPIVPQSVRESWRQLCGAFPQNNPPFRLPCDLMTKEDLVAETVLFEGGKSSGNGDTDCSPSSAVVEANWERHTVIPDIDKVKKVNTPGKRGQHEANSGKGSDVCGILDTPIKKGDILNVPHTRCLRSTSFSPTSSPSSSSPSSPSVYSGTKFLGAPDDSSISVEDVAASHTLFNSSPRRHSSTVNTPNLAWSRVLKSPQILLQTSPPTPLQSVFQQSTAAESDVVETRGGHLVPLTVQDIDGSADVKVDERQDSMKGDKSSIVGNEAVSSRLVGRVGNDGIVFGDDKAASKVGDEPVLDHTTNFTDPHEDSKRNEGFEVDNIDRVDTGKEEEHTFEIHPMGKHYEKVRHGEWTSFSDDETSSGSGTTRDDVCKGCLSELPPPGSDASDNTTNGIVKQPPKEMSKTALKSSSQEVLTLTRGRGSDRHFEGGIRSKQIKLTELFKFAVSRKEMISKRRENLGDRMGFDDGQKDCIEDGIDCEDDPCFARANGSSGSPAGERGKEAVTEGEEMKWSVENARVNGSTTHSNNTRRIRRNHRQLWLMDEDDAEVDGGPDSNVLRMRQTTGVTEVLEGPKKCQLEGTGNMHLGGNDVEVSHFNKAGDGHQGCCENKTAEEGPLYTEDGKRKACKLAEDLDSHSGGEGIDNEKEVVRRKCERKKLRRQRMKKMLDMMIEDEAEENDEELQHDEEYQSAVRELRRRLQSEGQNHNADNSDDEDDYDLSDWDADNLEDLVDDEEEDDGEREEGEKAVKMKLMEDLEKRDEMLLDRLLRNRRAFGSLDDDEEAKLTALEKRELEEERNKRKERRRRKRLGDLCFEGIELDDWLSDNADNSGTESDNQSECDDGGKDNLRREREGNLLGCRGVKWGKGHGSRRSRGVDHGNMVDGDSTADGEMEVNQYVKWSSLLDLRHQQGMGRCGARGALATEDGIKNGLCGLGVGGARNKWHQVIPSLMCSSSRNLPTPSKVLSSTSISRTMTSKASPSNNDACFPKATATGEVSRCLRNAQMREEALRLRQLRMKKKQAFDEKTYGFGAVRNGPKISSCSVLDAGTSLSVDAAADTIHIARNLIHKSSGGTEGENGSGGIRTSREDSSSRRDTEAEASHNGRVCNFGINTRGHMVTQTSGQSCYPKFGIGRHQSFRPVKEDKTCESADHHAKFHLGEWNRRRNNSFTFPTFQGLKSPFTDRCTTNTTSGTSKNASRVYTGSSIRILQELEVSTSLLHSRSVGQSFTGWRTRPRNAVEKENGKERRNMEETEPGGSDGKWKNGDVKSKSSTYTESVDKNITRAAFKGGSLERDYKEHSEGKKFEYGSRGFGGMLKKIGSIRQR